MQTITPHVERTAKILIEIEYPLPASEDTRELLYGTADISKCVEIDFNNDAAAMLCESESRVVKVEWA